MRRDLGPPIKETRRRWGGHQDDLLAAALKHRDACTHDAWKTPEQQYADAKGVVDEHVQRVAEQIDLGLADESLAEETKELLRGHVRHMKDIATSIPSLGDLRLRRLPVGDTVGEVLRKAPKQHERGPGTVLLRVDWTLKVEVTQLIHFSVGGKAEPPLSQKEATYLAMPLDEGFEERLAFYLGWRLAPLHVPPSVEREDGVSTWRFLILPPSTTAPQMLERLTELKRAVAASSAGKPNDRCGVVTDDKRHARIAKENGYLAYVPPLG